MANDERRKGILYPPQPNNDIDPEAVHAATSGDVPPPEPGNNGESAEGEPSRAEIFSMNPELASDVAAPGTPTNAEGPMPGYPYTAGAPVAGRTSAGDAAPPGERPADESTPAERHESMKPPMAPLSKNHGDNRQ